MNKNTLKEIESNLDSGIQLDINESDTETGYCLEYKIDHKEPKSIELDLDYKKVKELRSFIIEIMKTMSSGIIDPKGELPFFYLVPKESKRIFITGAKGEQTASVGVYDKDIRKEDLEDAEKLGKIILLMYNRVSKELDKDNE